MSTTYTLTIGYNNGGQNHLTEQQRWETLKQVAQEIANRPDRIIRETSRQTNPLTPPPPSKLDLIEYAERFSSDDATFNIIDDDRMIFLINSSTDPAKAIVRQAFCRLVIHQMQRLGIEVSLNVD